MAWRLRHRGSDGRHTPAYWPYSPLSPFRGEWSPDRKLALLQTEGGEALLFGAAQAAPVASIAASGRWYRAVWTADSKRILVADHEDAFRFTLVDLATPDRGTSWSMAKSPDSSRGPEPVGFLPDGRRLVVRVSTNGVRVVDAASGRAQGPELPVSGEVALSPGTPWLAHGVSGGGFRISDVETGRAIFVSERPLSSFVWFTGQPKLAVESGDTCLLWDAQHGLRELAAAGKPIWDRTGERLAFWMPADTSGSAERGYRCAECLMPVTWSSVYDAVSLREVASDAFVPDTHRYELSFDSIRDRVTGETRSVKLARTPLTGWPSFRDDRTLFFRGSDWAARIDLRTGKVTQWARDQAGESSVWDPEQVAICEEQRGGSTPGVRSGGESSTTPSKSPRAFAMRRGSRRSRERPDEKVEARIELQTLRDGPSPRGPMARRSG